MSFFSRETKFYGWINEKLKEFKHESSSKDSEELALWYLQFLKEEVETDEEIVKILGDIFKKVSKKSSKKDSHVWLGFDLKEFCRLSLWKEIVIDSYQREFNSFVKKDELCRPFFNSEWKDLKEDPRAKDFDSSNSNVIFEKPELNLKWFNSEVIEFDVLNIDKLENYSEFKEFIENEKQIALKDAQRVVVMQRALFLYYKDDKPLDVFVRSFGDDKDFKEEYYEIFEKYWKMAPNFLNLKTIQYTYQPSPDKETDRRNMLVAMYFALLDALKKFPEEED